MKLSQIHEARYHGAKDLSPAAKYAMSEMYHDFVDGGYFDDLELSVEVLEEIQSFFYSLT
jgi:hypothetical protein